VSAPEVVYSLPIFGRFALSLSFGMRFFPISPRIHHWLAVTTLVESPFVLGRSVFLFSLGLSDFICFPSSGGTSCVDRNVVRPTTPVLSPPELPVGESLRGGPVAM